MSPLNEPPCVGLDGRIGELVTGEPVAVGEQLTLREVAAVLATADIGAALVRRDDRALGIVSERDISRALADGADPDTVWSADVMTSDLVTTGPFDSVLAVALRMLDVGIRHIGVDDGGRIAGIVSSRDVFRVFAENALEQP